MQYSRWHSKEEFLASNAFRKEIRYRVEFSPSLAVYTRSLCEAEECICRSLDRFGNSLPASVRLCFNGAPVRGKCWHYPSAFNKVVLPSNPFSNVDAPEA